MRCILVQTRNRLARNLERLVLNITRILTAEAPDRRKLAHLTFSEAGAIHQERTPWRTVNLAAPVVLVLALSVLWWIFR